MKRTLAVIFAASIFLTAAANVPGGEPGADREKEDFLLSTLVGSYEVIGRLPESRKTYSGKVVISREGDKLVLERTVNGTKYTAEASVGTATADKVPVVRAAWKQGRTGYGATYLMHTDLDNYPRLTGYVYFSGRRNGTPGIEALFSRDAAGQ